MLIFLIEYQIANFLSPEGAFFTTANLPPSTSSESEISDRQPSDLLLRLKPGMDTAEPSANNISAMNLYRLSSLFNDEEYARIARETVQAFEVEIEQWPFCFAGLLGSVVVGQLGIKGVVIVGGNEESKAVKEILDRVRVGLGVRRTVAWVRGTGGFLRKRNKLLGDLEVKNGVRVCVYEKGSCREGTEYLS